MQLELNFAPQRRTLWRAGLVGLLLVLLIVLGTTWQQAGTIVSSPSLSHRSLTPLVFETVVEKPILALASAEPGAWLGAADGLYYQANAEGELVRALPQSGDPLPLNVHALHAEGDLVYVSFTRLPVVTKTNGEYAFQPVEAAGGEIRAGIATYTLATGEWHVLRPETPAWGFSSWRGAVYANTNTGVVNVHTGERLGPPTEALGFVLHSTPEDLYAGMQDGLWRWDGVNWRQVLPTTMQKVLGISELDGELYAAINEQGLYHSPDGLTWTLVAQEPSVQALGVDTSNRQLYLGGEGLWRYDADTKALQPVPNIQAEVRSALIHHDHLYLGTNQAAYRQVTGEVGQ